MLTGDVFAQNVTIKGSAPAYAGKVIEVLTAVEYVAFTLQKTDMDTVSADGFFELHLNTDYTQPVFLKTGNISGQLYVQPGYKYSITYPEVDYEITRKNAREIQVNIGVIGRDSTELNALIFDFQEQYNTLFLQEDGRFLGRAHMFKRADSLKRLCDSRYKDIENAYFKTYIDYSIASINANLSRGENALIGAFIVNRPIQYQHHEYMKFFNACFKSYLTSIAAQRGGQSMFNIVNVKSDYPLLRNFLMKETLINNDTLAELILISNLWEMYFNSEFVPDAVHSILDQINAATRIKEHKEILENILLRLNNMQEGSPAPDFSARTKTGAIATLSTYKGRWIYLNFFSTANVESLKEMPKIAALKRKYGDKVLFISVCLDDSLKTYLNYLRSNPRFDWPIWFSNEKTLSSTAGKNYFVTGTEAYFFIGNDGYLAQSPALSPSQGIEYKFNNIFRIRTRKTKTGIR